MLREFQPAMCLHGPPGVGRTADRRRPNTIASAASARSRRRKYARRCIPRGCSGKGSDTSALPPSASGSSVNTYVTSHRISLLTCGA